MTAFRVAFVRNPFNRAFFEAFVDEMEGDPINVEHFCIAVNAMVDLAQFFTLIASDLAQKSGGNDG